MLSKGTLNYKLQTCIRTKEIQVAYALISQTSKSSILANRVTTFACEGALENMHSTSFLMHSVPNQGRIQGDWGS